MTPIPDTWRLVVRLKSRRALAEYVKFHRLTGRGLARQAGLKPAIVGHLLSGRRSTCSLRTATAIEEALQCPPGFLFVPKVSPVADATRQTGRAA